MVATVLLSSLRATADPLVLDRGEVLARLSIEANVERRKLARPLSYAPDLWIGVTERLTVGLIHSSRSVDRIAAGASFCVRELAGRCEHVYRGGGVDLRWAWRPQIAWRARLLLRDMDPVKPAVTLGALVRTARGRLSITSDPYLRIGLGNRQAGNRDALVIPVWVGIRIGGSVEVLIHTGIDGDLVVWRDGWHIPLGLGVEVTPSRAISLGIEAGFPSLLGPQNTGDQRAATLFASWRGR